MCYRLATSSRPSASSNLCQRQGKSSISLSCVHNFHFLFFLTGFIPRQCHPADCMFVCECAEEHCGILRYYKLNRNVRISALANGVGLYAGMWQGHTMHMLSSYPLLLATAWTACDDSFCQLHAKLRAQCQSCVGKGNTDKSNSASSFGYRCILSVSVDQRMLKGSLVSSVEINLVRSLKPVHKKHFWNPQHT